MNTDPRTTPVAPDMKINEKAVHDSEATAARDELDRMTALQESQLRVPR